MTDLYDQAKYSEAVYVYNMVEDKTVFSAETRNHYQMMIAAKDQGLIEIDDECILTNVDDTYDPVSALEYLDL